MDKNHPATDAHCPLDWLHQLQLQYVYLAKKRNVTRS